MRAFLEKIDKDYLDDFVYCSKYPLLERDITIKDFDGLNLQNLVNLKLTKDDIMIGSVQACERFFKIVSGAVPKYLGYPESLKPFLRRKITTSKFGKLKPENLPFFIKPKHDVKRFTGTLIKEKSSLQFISDYYKEIDDNTELYVSEPMDPILSEWRCFVHKNSLRGIQYYAGDFRIYPDTELIEEMIKSYIDAPIAYTLDVAVTLKANNKLTTLIEINDMWAIGSYGFNSTEYVQMTIDRFREILN